MTAAVRRVLVVSVAGTAAAVHHIATSAVVLFLAADWFVVSVIAGHAGQAITAATVGVLLAAEGIRADRVGRPFPHCPVCPLVRRGARKETAK
ncbi:MULTISPECIES: hypothetical protein [Streptomyces]|uniref:Secreted protein n=1 Tax=Streptomyces violascens TaxID=67381 RepID=A0ABQ3QRD4_9ACTN|nr:MULTISPECIES: hypothetical protein [Streptomyces]EST17953.1 hypothetical protein M877_39795 [Streptomyces niveus NCIMB 11891]GHI39837.1 hypothetical protein Sviol_42450 [Streptomyces violascens]